MSISRYAPHSFLENRQNLWRQNGIFVISESLSRLNSRGRLRPHRRVVA